MLKALETGHPPYLAQQLCPYAPTRALRCSTPNFFKFHVPTSGLAHAIFTYLLPPSGTHCLAVFVSVNFLQLSGNTLKHFISKLHSLAPPSDPLPQRLKFKF